MGEPTFTDAQLAQIRLLVREELGSLRAPGSLLIDDATLQNLLAAARLLSTLAQQAMAASAEASANRKIRAGDQSGNPA